jgi:glycerol-3-phosphate dehydrogenase (NAD(P)+)
MTMRITMIGDGAMGTLCANMLAENGMQVRLWSAFPDAAEEMRLLGENRRFLPGVPLAKGVEITSRDDQAFEHAQLAVSAVPTQYIRGVWQRLCAHVPPNLGICSVAKGIEVATLLRPTQVLADVLGGDRPLAALSGPSIAPEIARHLPATVAVASEHEEFARQVQEIITRPYFRVYTNSDVIGVEVAGATKNVIAIAAGILDGLGAGDNAKAALLTRGLVEISRLGVAMGAKPQTFAGLAGMGDLVTTCFSPIGRNRSFGEAVGKGQKVEDALSATNSVVEGVATTSGVVELARRHQVEMPITQGVYDVLFNNMSPSQAINELMARPLKSEE